MKIENWSWKPKPDYTRLLKAIHRQGDPTYVPFLELFADRELIAHMLGEPVIPNEAQLSDRGALEKALDQKICFWHQLGYSAFWQGAILIEPEIIPLEANDTALFARDKRLWFNEKAGVITNWQDFEYYPWYCAEDADLYPMEYVASHLPEGMGIIAEIRGVFEFVMKLMGYETLAFALYDQPDLVEALFNKHAEIYLPLARTLVQMDGVIALWMGDDMGFKTGTLVSPAHLRRFVFPLQKQYAALAHEQGIPFLLHSCGNLETVMDDLIDDVRIDAKHSFEDVIIRVEDFSSRYHQQIAAIGGVDVDLLARGTEEQVRARTREILGACSPSKSYILGSGNSITNYVRPDNFLAMLDEGQRFNAGRRE